MGLRVAGAITRRILIRSRRYLADVATSQFRVPGSGP